MVLKTLRVKTEGTAFLRNGYINLTAIGVELDQSADRDVATILGFSTRGAKSGEGGIGHEANGYFWIPVTALVELARKIVCETMDEEDRIIVTTEDGIVVDTKLPDWLQGLDVRLIDLDCRATGQCPSCGELGYDDEAERCEACGLILEEYR